MSDDPRDEQFSEGYRAGYVKGYGEGVSDGRFQGYAEAKFRAFAATRDDLEAREALRASLGEE